MGSGGRVKRELKHGNWGEGELKRGKAKLKCDSSGEGELRRRKAGVKAR